MINISDAYAIARGSSFFGTGGGLNLEDQLAIFDTVLSGASMPLLNINELSEDTSVCAVYCVGSAAKTSIDPSRSLKQGVLALEQACRKNIGAIFAGEANIDALIFQAAAMLKMPVLDADGTGGRAVPELRIDNFMVVDRSTLPLVALTPEGKMLVIENQASPVELENAVRTLAVQSPSGFCTVFDHCIGAREAVDLLTFGGVQRSLRLGRYIEANRGNSDILSGVRKQLNATLLFEGVIESSALSNDSTSGFLVGTYDVAHRDGQRLRVFVKNENLSCVLNEQLLLTCPDLIITVDKDRLIGLHNSKVENGKEVQILGVRATDLWRREEGIKLFSPESFGLWHTSKLL